MRTHIYLSVFQVRQRRPGRSLARDLRRRRPAASATALRRRRPTA